MSEPAVVEIPHAIFRVARSRGLLTFSRITPEDAELRTAGNRFDVPGGAVLYAASTVIACYAETLARFRPTPRIREKLSDEPGFMVIGGVPRDWRLQRSVAEIKVDGALPFLDVEDPGTQDYLSEVLHSRLVALGYTDNLDFSDVCNRDRRLSRAIAQYAYTATDEDSRPVYSGIRYSSRLNPAWECWAVFDGTPHELVEERAIELHDTDLQEVAKIWNLTLF